MTLHKAAKDDLPEILKLQYLAYQSEAALLNNPEIPPLKQTLPEVEAELDRGVVLKAVDNEGKLIGSVRGYLENGTLYVGKLIVHPEKQGQGIGTALLDAMEQALPHQRCELFTSSMSEKNIRLYRRAGYKPFAQRQVSDNLTFVYLEK